MPQVCLQWVFTSLSVNDIKVNNLTCRSASCGTKVLTKPGLQKQEQDTKRRKVNHPSENVVELDAVSSDDEINIVLRR